MRYSAEVTVKLKAGMLDPEGTTIKRALEHLGYFPDSVRSAKEYLIELEAESSDMARDQIDQMCQKLIANPIIHDYTIDLREIE
ncbi:phosphoribosylformylglycinamidine synthase [Methanohalophilus levihalophilus]|uniref:phosphoribosylformylglycinamidine synthase subunit PurS n=1 Tax=Methanohalophilus levihalophilus TaxID=1431282 RepID=UPI001AE7C999|nr:phosphoribosylformylglycinamidine synthase subunit PurS [Methanohalophilus levihalophilus]MBP2029761.1 phosphoribosylformylglycinamidine synthase [Methanohalophilus levihalophilus]